MENAEEKPAVYIDENVDIHEGAEAEAMLKDRRTFHLVDARYGITEVDQNRWEEAQRYEKRVWMDLNPASSSDRNEDHWARFAKYVDLKGKAFRRGIELGCGPFTNMRFIVQSCAVDEVYLLDPLIDSYLKHPGCQYKHRRFSGVFNALADGSTPKTFRHLRECYRMGGWRGKPVRIVASMIEECPVSDSFDLAVMINVIEHCRNVHAVFHKILDLLSPGGVFVFHDRLYNAGELEKLSERLYDAGHPLRVDQSVVREFLGRHFDAMMSRETEVAREYKSVTWRETEFYYIGKKKQNGSGGKG